MRLALVPIYVPNVMSRLCQPLVPVRDPKPCHVTPSGTQQRSPPLHWSHIVVIGVPLGAFGTKRLLPYRDNGNLLHALPRCQKTRMKQ
jgi:hypothetical protein